MRHHVPVSLHNGNTLHNIVQYHNQEVDIGKIHQLYSGQMMLFEASKTIVLKILKQQLLTASILSEKHILSPTNNCF